MSQADLDKLVEDRDYQFAKKIAYEFKDMKNEHPTFPIKFRKKSQDKQSSKEN